MKQKCKSQIRVSYFIEILDKYSLLPFLIESKKVKIKIQIIKY